MAANLNKVFLMGNLTRDPDVRYTPKGTAVGDLGMAINDTYKAQDGTIKEVVTYVDIEVWGRQAETCKQYLSKGRSVFIEGALKFDQWESPEGQKKSKLRVPVERAEPADKVAAQAAPATPAAVALPASSRRSLRVRPRHRREPAKTSRRCPRTTIFHFRDAVLLPIRRAWQTNRHSIGPRLNPSWATTRRR
jgi:single-strand DNA-binding protein